MGLALAGVAMTFPDYTADERAAMALEYIADHLEDIAGTLDDYMDLTLAGQAATAAMQASDPALEPILRPLTEAMRKIADRRAAR